MKQRQDEREEQEDKVQTNIEEVSAEDIKKENKEVIILAWRGLVEDWNENQSKPVKNLKL